MASFLNTFKFIPGMRPKQKRLIKIVLNKLTPLSKDSKILDIGCGQGLFVRELRKKGFKIVHGLDIIDRREFRDFTYHNIDICAETINLSEKFDAIVCMEVIEHTKNPWKLIENCAALLNPGGHLILTRPNMTNLFSRIYFLFTGEVLRFRPKKTNNMNIITLKIMQMMTSPYFKLISLRADRSTLPIIHLQLPPTKLFGNSLIYHFIKRHKIGKPHTYFVGED